MHKQCHTSMKGELLIPPSVPAPGVPQHRSRSCSGKAPRKGPDHLLMLGKGAALVSLAFGILSVPMEGTLRHASDKGLQ